MNEFALCLKYGQFQPVRAYKECNIYGEGTDVIPSTMRLND